MGTRLCEMIKADPMPESGIAVAHVCAKHRPAYEADGWHFNCFSTQECEACADAAPPPTKVYLFIEGHWLDGDISCTALADDGNIVCQHICSGEEWMYWDLYERPSRKQLYDEKFPNGYEIILVPDGCKPPLDVWERHLAIYEAQFAQAQE